MHVLQERFVGVWGVHVLRERFGVWGVHVLQERFGVWGVHVLQERFDTRGVCCTCLGHILAQVVCEAHTCFRGNLTRLLRTAHTSGVHVCEVRYMWGEFHSCG